MRALIYCSWWIRVSNRFHIKHHSERLFSPTMPIFLNLPLVVAWTPDSESKRLESNLG